MPQKKSAAPRLGKVDKLTWLDDALTTEPTKVSNSAVAIGLIVYGASVGSGGIHISHGDLADLADLAPQSCAMQLPSYAR